MKCLDAFRILDHLITPLIKIAIKSIKMLANLEVYHPPESFPGEQVVPRCWPTEVVRRHLFWGFIKPPPSINHTSLVLRF